MSQGERDNSGNRGGRRQNRGGQNRKGGENKNQKSQNNNNNNNGRRGSDKQRQIFKKEYGALDKLQEEQTKLKLRREEIQRELDVARDSVRDVRKQKNEVREKLRKVSAQRQSMIKSKKELVARSKSIRKAQTGKREVLDGMAAELPYKSTSSADFAKKNEEILDRQIEEKQDRIEMSSLSLLAEKRLLSEINLIQRTRSLIRDCEQKRMELEAERPALDAIHSQLKGLDAELDQLKESETAWVAELKQFNETIGKMEAHVPALVEERKQIFKRLKELSRQWNVCRDELKAAQDKYYAAQRERYAAQKEEQKIRDAERKKKAAERAQIEALRLPYEDELAICGTLIQYLAQYRRQRKKASHPFTTYAAFEQLSMVPPATPDEANAAIADVEAKRAHFKALRKAEKERRQKAEAARKAKQEEQEQADAAAADAVDATADATASSSSSDAQDEVAKNDDEKPSADADVDENAAADDDDDDDDDDEKVDDVKDETANDDDNDNNDDNDEQSNVDDDVVDDDENKDDDNATNDDA